jgi:hypothetical protein
MKTSIILAALAVALLPITALAAPAKPNPAVSAHKSAKATATMYECSKCHMRVSAAVAKKDHYKDPMDGGALVPVKTAKATGK